MNIVLRRGNPFMTFPRLLRGYPRDIFRSVKYQIKPGARGAPVVELTMHAHWDLPVVLNPDMSLVLLMDRSGSMSETFAEGHVFQAANSILTQLGPGGGFNIAFYDDTPSYVGWIDSSWTLDTAIGNNPPRGGTVVSDALLGAIKRYQGDKRGIYVIVVTDGRFSDAARVQSLIQNDLAQRITPDNPYALRLHFIGAGEGTDEKFLEQLEGLASSQGAPLVRAHRHAHLSHAHVSMRDELRTIYIGAGLDLVVEGPEGVLVRAGDPIAQHWEDGHTYRRGFLPADSVISLEYAQAHPRELTLKMGLTLRNGQRREFELNVPLPRSTQSGSNLLVTQGRTGIAGYLHLPQPPMSREAREAREAALRIAQQAREEELKRQTANQLALSKGGIPSTALLRLREESGDTGATSSNLAPGEIALLRRRGVVPVGLVVGSAMYHIGQPTASSSQDSEVKVLTQAYNEATRLAVSRLEQETAILGAHGVVGVRYTIVRREWATHSVEVQIIGTAVTTPDDAPSEPWLSDLSGQEWWALRRAGFDSTGLVYGHGVWFVLTTDQDEQTKRFGRNNVEFAHQSTGVSSARHLALAHLKAQAKAHGATHIVGVHFNREVEEVRLKRGPGQPERKLYEYEHHIITLSMIGTSARVRHNAPRRIPATRHVLSLAHAGRSVPTPGHATDASFE